MLRKIDISFKNKLGKGTFGHVYKCTAHDKAMAVKCIKLSNNGVSDLLEASIMATYKNHPNLCGALSIHIENDALYIFMEMAIGDMFKVIADGNNEPSLVIGWCYNIACGLRVLHHEKIIHGDIKSNNILLMPNGTAKLTDYTLSALAESIDGMFTYPVCTLNYRPPECFMSRPWGFSVDIWAMACTFYEMMCGDILIPYQADRVTHPKGLASPEGKQELRQLTLSAIIAWCQSRGEPGTSALTVPNNNCMYVSYTDKYNSSNQLFKDLIMRMMKFIPTDRFSIKSVIQHKFFDDYRNSNTDDGDILDISTVRLYKINDQILRIIDLIVPKCLDQESKYIEEKTKEIMAKCINMNTWSDAILIKLDKILVSLNGVGNATDTTKLILDTINLESKNWKDECNIFGCLWIASKILNGIQPRNVDMNIDVMKGMEIRICEYLGFCLHRSV